MGKVWRLYLVFLSVILVGYLNLLVAVIYEVQINNRRKLDRRKETVLAENMISSQNEASGIQLGSLSLHDDQTAASKEILSLSYINVTEDTPDSSLKKILIFNFRSEQQQGHFMHASDEDYGISKCSSTNCFLTRNRTYYGPESLGHFDAILFQGVASADPLSDYTAFHASQRHPNQIFIFGTVEPPTHLQNKEHNFMKNFYNATMTYRQDSDIYSPYGSIVPRKSSARRMFKASAGVKIDWASTYTPFDAQRFSDSLKNLSRNFTDLATRPKKIAWIASSCKTFSNREDYVEELQKHIQVDVYGECGNLTCVKGEQCDDMLKRDYKFFLAFENSICEDYVTEKFFARAVQLQLLPVVMGGASYSKYAPSHSHLNVKDFQSPKALGDYIQFLDENPLEYLSYFWWVPNHRLKVHKPICQLCNFLNQPLKYHKTVEDVIKTIFQVDNKRACKVGPFPWTKPNWWE